MADLPRQHPSLTIHLSDASLTPILSSCPAPSAAQPFPPPLASSADRAIRRADAVAYLTHTLLTARDLASRLGHGPPQRIMIETTGGGGSSSSSSSGGGAATSGPLVLGTFLEPAATAPLPTPSSQPLPLSPGPESSAALPPSERARRRASAGPALDAEDSGDGGGSSNGPPPLLVGLVVAPSGSTAAGEARRAAARLERLGHNFQVAWLQEDTAGLQPPRRQNGP